MVYFWVDANVLLRFITGDPPGMAAAVLELMERAEKGEVKLKISHLILAEVVWVLSSYYKFPKSEIADVLISLITADGIEVEEEGLAVKALLNMSEKNVDFADALLAARVAANKEPVCSFDRDFEKLDVVLAVPPCQDF